MLHSWGPLFVWGSDTKTHSGRQVMRSQRATGAAGPGLPPALGGPRGKGACGHRHVTECLSALPRRTRQGLAPSPPRVCSAPRGWWPWWSMQPFAVGQCSPSPTQMSFRTDQGPGTQATGATVTKRPGTSALTVPQARGPRPGWAGPPPLKAPGRAVPAASVSLPSPASSLDAGLSAHVPYV